MIGVVAGFLAGLLGIGGGMLMVPFLTIILTHRGVDAGLAVKMAIATAMATIAFTSLSSVRAHQRLGSVRWDVVARMAPGIVAGGLLSGGAVFSVLKGQWLAWLFAAFAAFSASQMVLDRKPRPFRTLPRSLGQVSTGAGIGLASGLVGAGGAFLSVPYMVWCNVPIRQAIGTSAALGFPIAVGNTAGYLIGGRDLPAALPGAVGFLYLPALLIISVASMALAPQGARLAHRLDVRRMKRSFAALLLVLAAYMLYRASSGS